MEKLNLGRIELRDRGLGQSRRNEGWAKGINPKAWTLGGRPRARPKFEARIQDQGERAHSTSLRLIFLLDYFFKEPPQNVEMQESEQEVIEPRGWVRELDGTQAPQDGGECGVPKHGQPKTSLKVSHEGAKDPKVLNILFDLSCSIVMQSICRDALSSFIENFWRMCFL